MKTTAEEYFSPCERHQTERRENYRLLAVLGECEECRDLTRAAVRLGALSAAAKPLTPSQMPHYYRRFPFWLEGKRDEDWRRAMNDWCQAVADWR